VWTCLCYLAENLFRISNFVTNFKFCYEFPNLLRISKFVTNFKICYEFQNLFRTSKFVTNFDIWRLNLLCKYRGASKSHFYKKKYCFLTVLHMYQLDFRLELSNISFLMMSCRNVFEIVYTNRVSVFVSMTVRCLKAYHHYY